MAGRGAAGALGPARPGAPRPPCRWASRPLDDFNTGDNEGIGLLPRQPEDAACAGRSARGFIKPVLDRARQPRPRAPACWSRRSSSRTASAPPACSSARAAERVIARCRGEVVLTAGSIGSTQILAALRHRPRRLCCSGTASPLCRTSPASAATCRITCSIRAIYQGPGRQDAERDLPQPVPARR